MVKDAEAHAAADKAQREVIEAKNELDTLTYSLEKTVNEAGDKIGANEKQLATDEIKRAREAIESNDKARIESAKASISKIATDIASKVYSQSAPGAEQAAAGGPNGSAGSNDQGNSTNNGEKVVDADYTVVDDEKK